MASRRDQLQSYQFLVQRVVSALVLRETDPAQSPLRRLTGATFASVMVAVVGLAAAGVYGLVRPGGNTAWRSGKSVIVERETGTRYVFRDGKLHPVANYASALLILGAGTGTTDVSRESLSGVPRGPRLGIPDAPDAVPDRAHLLGSPWTLCSQPARNDAGAPVASTVLVAGRKPRDGRALGDRAVLAEDPASHKQFLIWHDHRHEIAGQEAVEALVLRQERHVLTGAAWLNALPAGVPLAPMAIPGRGAPSSAVAGARVGQVFVNVQGGQKQYYAALARTLAPITRVQAEILVAAKVSQAAYPGGAAQIRDLLPSVAAAAPKEPPAPAGAGQPPAERPAMAELPDGDPAVCAAFAGARGEPQVLVGATVAGQGDGIATVAQTAEGGPLADRVLVEPGWGALVEAMQSPDAPHGSLYLVTDDGARYALASPEVAAALGLDGADPVKLPASLVARIPAGSALDPAAAAKPVTR